VGQDGPTPCAPTYTDPMELANPFGVKASAHPSTARENYITATASSQTTHHPGLLKHFKSWWSCFHHDPLDSLESHQHTAKNALRHQAATTGGRQGMTLAT